MEEKEEYDLSLLTVFESSYHLGASVGAVWRFVLSRFRA